MYTRTPLAAGSLLAVGALLGWLASASPPNFHW
jgi:hypothetical protein